MLSLRLLSLEKYIDYNDNIIDIGCDHALLDVYLVKNVIVRNMIVSDVHENALNQGIENIKKNNLEKKIDARLGNGLEVLTKKDKVDTLLISGMGTSTILSILENDYTKNINKMIIQSNNDHSLLRSEIIKKGFFVSKEEYLVDNNKNYINIVFVRGEKKYSKNEIKYGPILIHNKMYLNFELKNVEKIYNLVPRRKLKYRFILKREIKLLNKLIKETSKN